MKVDMGIVRSQIAKAVSGAVVTNDPWLDARWNENPCPYFRLFYSLVGVMSPEHVVELGTYRATATAHFAAGCPTALVTTVDKHDSDAIAREKTLEVLGRYDNVSYVRGCTWADETVARITRRPPIDILYIDAAHEYVQAIRDWRQYSRLLSDEALVIADDIFDSPGYTVDLVRFWNEMSAGYERFLSHDIHNIPMGFMRFVR